MQLHGPARHNEAEERRRRDHRKALGVTDLDVPQSTSATMKCVCVFLLLCSREVWAGSTSARRAEHGWNTRGRVCIAPTPAV